MKQFSVTQVLGAFVDFSAIPPHVLEWAAKRGSRVHDACASYATGLYVSERRLRDFDPKALFFFLSFKNWFAEHVARVIWVEVELRCDLYGFYGHLDLFALMRDGRKVITDYKTPALESATWKAQLAGYRHLVGVNYGGLYDCQSVMLNGEGRAAKAVTYQYSDDDFVAFLSALNAYRYFN